MTKKGKETARVAFRLSTLLMSRGGRNNSFFLLFFIYLPLLHLFEFPHSQKWSRSISLFFFSFWLRGGCNTYVRPVGSAWPVPSVSSEHCSPAFVEGENINDEKKGDTTVWLSWYYIVLYLLDSKNDCSVILIVFVNNRFSGIELVMGLMYGSLLLNNANFHSLTFLHCTSNFYLI